MAGAPRYPGRVSSGPSGSSGSSESSGRSPRAPGAPLRRVTARLEEATAERPGDRPGVRMRFRPVHAASAAALGVRSLEDFADLGAFPAGSELSVPVALGVGRVLRILRAARIAGPADPLELVGREERAAELLRRARGRPLCLTLRRRSRLRFLAWGEDGLHVADDLLDVREVADAYLAYPARGGAPLRFARRDVARVSREIAPWYEVVEVERADVSRPPRRR